MNEINEIGERIEGQLQNNGRPKWLAEYNQFLQGLKVIMKKINVTRRQEVSEKMTELGLRVEDYEIQNRNSYFKLFKKTKNGTRSQHINSKEREALSKIGFRNALGKNFMVLHVYEK